MLVPPEEDTETDESVGSWLTSSDGGESGADDESEGDDFSGVRAAETSPARVEPDRWDACCTALARLLRDRPTLPADASEPGRSMVDVETPWRLPLYSCPFKQCTFHTDERQRFLEHLGTSTGASPHYAQIRAHCEPCLSVAEPLDCVHRAVALLEQDRIPCIGPATTRRALRTVTTYYNDTKIKAIVCFVCGQIHSTMEGPSGIDPATGAVVRPRSHISLQSRRWLQEVERNSPGTLLNNCSFELWRKRYMHGKFEEDTPAHERADIFATRAPTGTTPGTAYSHSEWCVRLPLAAGEVGSDVALFGVTEDVRCNAPDQGARHRGDALGPLPHCRRLCEFCEVPICRECAHGLAKFDERAKPCSTVPMALANDHYYGYVFAALAKGEVTWLECAAASLVWTTIMVYYLEQPYGH